MPDGDLDEAKEGEESEREVVLKERGEGWEDGIVRESADTGNRTPDLRSGSRVCKPLSYAASNRFMVSKSLHIEIVCQSSPD